MQQLKFSSTEEQIYIEMLIANGQAARPDKDGRMPNNTTHLLYNDEKGNLKVRRICFSMCGV